MGDQVNSLKTNSGGTAPPDVSTRLTVPTSLQQQLSDFRSRVWSTKLGEAVVLGVVAVLLAFLTVYTADRFFDTPQLARFAIFVVSLAVWFVVPWAIHRWIWKNRRLDQLARLLRVREPAVGDQLLSVIELAENESEQARSRTLCAAAIKQVAEAAKSRDFRTAAPPNRLRSLSTVLVLASVATLALSLLFPAAAKNAWARFSAPWRDTPRFTFTEIQPLPPNLVVAHGETTLLAIALKSESRWQPTEARLQINGLPQITSALDGNKYEFELPPLTSPTAFRLQVGDYAQQVRLEPKLRPELTDAVATVALPKYLQRSAAIDQDVRSGLLSVVEGSSAVVNATASRDLRAATINAEAVAVEQASFSTQPISLTSDEQSMSIAWEDFDGLAGREPFQLTIRGTVDELPSVVSQNLPRQAVVLDSEQINFECLSADDFGIKRIGMSWRGLDDTLLVDTANGEKVLAAGDPNGTSMQTPGVFCAADLRIPAQPIEVRLWAEDFNPEHERMFSAPHILYVLTAEQHAIWITDQLSKWHRASLDVRDKELQLHEANKRLREMTPEELADEEMRKELRRQSSLEAANGRRLSGLSRVGEDLLRQASRNPEIGVGHLDRWAEMLQILNDIGSNRMPSVSELLDKASSDQQIMRGGMSKKESAPMAGSTRSGGGAGGPPPEERKDNPEQPVIPKVVDGESSMQPNEEEESDPNKKGKKKFNGSRQGLATTTLAGPAKKSEGDEEEQEEEPEEDGDNFEQALVEQADLLAEFERVAEELNTILANLEGSTLVKRLKAASREQTQVAETIGSRIDAVFGRGSQVGAEDRKVLEELTEVEEQSSQQLSYIMDDMQSYFERRRMNQFKVVLDDMKQSDVLMSLQVLGEDIPSEHGMSIAQAEYWSDTLDRWAEDLVDPAGSGECPGCKTSDSLPPSLILEVLRILEGEVNLREATRVAEQAREAADPSDHNAEASRLSETQSALRERTDKVVFNIEELPKGSDRFAKEIDLLTSVSAVMTDATDILAQSNTGTQAIAAETHAIELLLQCKRINPKSGGGGGSSPGGGGKGETQDSALALLGSGLNQNERREAREISQSTGETGRVLPEEYRAGLDEYFNRLEQGL